MTAIAARFPRLRRKEKLKSPMPKLFLHPIKYLKTAGISAVFGHLGIFTVVALYYILFQTNHDVKHAWDNLVSGKILGQPWAYWRHTFRNVGEYFLGIMLAQQIVYNSFKRKMKLQKKIEHANNELDQARQKGDYKGRIKWNNKLDYLERGSWLDRLEIKLHIINFYQLKVANRKVSVWQLLAAPVLAFCLYGLPGYFLGWGLIQVLHHVLHAGSLAPTLGAHPSFVAKLYSSDAEQHVIGVIAGIFMGRRVMKPAFEYTQRYFAERRVALGKKAHFYHPLPFQVLVKETRREHESGSKYDVHAAMQSKSNAMPAALTVATFALIGFSAFGYHVLHDIAK